MKVPAEAVLQALMDRAATDPLLALHIEVAMWRAAYELEVAGEEDSDEG